MLPHHLSILPSATEKKKKLNKHKFSSDSRKEESTWMKRSCSRERLADNGKMIT